MLAEGRIYSGSELSADEDVSCDVCVIGSGAGGAVMAERLVSRGLRVVMLEAGGYHTRREFDMEESRAFTTLYQDHGTRATDDFSIGILQGRSVGGGTTVNWCSSFRTPERVLAHWRNVHGLGRLTRAALEPHWDALERRLNVASWPLERINANNRVLWDGLGKLGYQRALLKRNVRQCADLGYCGMGCPIDAKQSMGVTLIPDAVKQGLTVVANAQVERLVLAGRRVARVEARLLDEKTDAPRTTRLTVRPRVTVLAGGAINSPWLLLRSGLTGEGLVGKRTWLHPTVLMLSEHEAPVEAFRGAPQSVYSHHFLDRGHDRLGFLLEVPPVHPMLAALISGGLGEAHQRLMSRLPYLQVTLGICIDGFHPQEVGGTVGQGEASAHRPSFHYGLGELHAEVFRAACKEMARIQFAAGAKRVVSLHAQPRVLESEGDIDRLLDAAPFGAQDLRVVTAHQMGGCAMGDDETRSVVDEHLRYRGLANLFLADGSVLPTGLGVNPQETIWGLARWAADGVAATVS